MCGDNSPDLFQPTRHENYLLNWDPSPNTYGAFTEAFESR